MAEALFLLKNGYIQETDIKGTSHAQIANGEIVENTRILLHKIDIGGIEINDVDATVSHNLNAPLLLGQSAINKLGTIQLDGTNLIIKTDKGIEEHNDNKLDVFYLGLLVLIVTVIGFLLYIVFSKLKKHHDYTKVDYIRIASSKRIKSIGISSKLAWFKSRKYIIYIAYGFMLLLSLLVIDLHIKNKRDNLYSNMIGQVYNSIGGINQSIDALNFDKIDELEYEEVPISHFKIDGDNSIMSKKERKQWNKMFSGIEHVYKITDGGWSMTGMQSTLIPNEYRYVRHGIQDYYYFPYMICVPYGVKFNSKIAKTIIEISLDKVYCEPDQYNAAQKTKSISNKYFHFVGQHFSIQDSLPELFMHFCNETTGTDPIYDKGKFTGYYWFGMHKIGQFRVLFAYQNGTAWRIEEKGGFNASLKDRIIYYSIVIFIFTSLLCLFLYYIKRMQKESTSYEY